MVSKDNLFGSRIMGGNTVYTRDGADFYPTPPDVTEALLQHLSLPKGTVIWEPACGKGDMVDVFIHSGYETIATDLNDQGYGETGIDFLTTDLRFCGWIITNPPFKLAEKFIRRCALHKKPFALLLKSQYWHSRSRYSLFCEIPPAEILPLTWRPDFLFKARGGSPLMDCIWCVWRNGERDTRYHPLTRNIEQISLFGCDGK